MPGTELSLALWIARPEPRWFPLPTGRVTRWHLDGPGGRQVLRDTVGGELTGTAGLLEAKLCGKSPCFLWTRS